MAVVNFKTYEQNYSAIGKEASQLRSHSFVECTLGCVGGTDTVSLPVQVCTTVAELKDVLCAKLGYIDSASIAFITKSASSYRVLRETDQVQTKMTVKGVKSFKPPLHNYPHPYGIIGAGYNGIKTALFLSRDGQTDYTIFDRYDRVGGHCWLEAANKTTRLQTEFPCYHVWYGAEWSNPDSTLCGGPPTDWEFWPTRNRLLEHFQLAAEEYGVIPHIHFKVDVESTDLRGKSIHDPDRYFEFTCVPKTYEQKEVQGGGAMAHQISGKHAEKEDMSAKGYAKRFVPDPTRTPYMWSCSCFCMWPGCLTNPRQITYKGEELFDGIIEYGLEMRFDYKEVEGKNTIIHGHGAFGMENVRTCVEHGSKHTYLVCRKRNLTCPRVVSWFINRSSPPITAVQCLDQLQIAYKHCNYDPWDMHSVSANSKRTHATLNAKTRFGIGDIYFLACAYGVLEIVVDNIKRCTGSTVHLESGAKLEDISNILKCTGMLPDWTVDKVTKMKHLFGFWINGDPRRFICADPDGLQASNLGTTTVGPGAYGLGQTMKHFWDCPNDWARLEADGHLATVPTHKQGEPNPETPAYFIDARHANGTGITIAGVSPLLAEKQAKNDMYKNWIVNYCSPADKFIAAATKEWNDYEDMFREKGMIAKDTPRIPYLYSVEWVQQQDERHTREMMAKYGGSG